MHLYDLEIDGCPLTTHASDIEHADKYATEEAVKVANTLRRPVTLQIQRRAKGAPKHERIVRPDTRPGDLR